jgi:putative membrane protein
MEFLALLGKTLLLRPYVFLFLAVAVAVATSLMGRMRAALFFLLTWVVAFVCEFSSTRTGIPFGWYFYNGSTRGQELYISNVPFMDSLSFTFLLFGSYCVALVFASPRSSDSAVTIRYDLAVRTSGRVLVFSVFFFVLLDVVIDPVALRGDRWFLGKIYYYPIPGLHFGVPLANYLGWGVVGIIALGLFQWLDRRLSPQSSPYPPERNAATVILIGCALYYTVLAFNLVMTFWIGESLMGWSGILIFLPVTALLAIKLAGRVPASSSSESPV